MTMLLPQGKVLKAELGSSSPQHSIWHQDSAIRAFWGHSVVAGVVAAAMAAVAVQAGPAVVVLVAAALVAALDVAVEAAHSAAVQAVQAVLAAQAAPAVLAAQAVLAVKAAPAAIGRLAERSSKVIVLLPELTFGFSSVAMQELLGQPRPHVLRRFAVHCHAAPG